MSDPEPKSETIKEDPLIQDEPVEPPPAKPEAPFPNLVGIDFGSQKIVLALASPEIKIPTIIRNDISDLQTPNIIAFNGKERLIGENAKGRGAIHPHSAVSQSSQLLGRSYEELQKLGLPFPVEPGPLIKIPYGDEVTSFTPEQVAAMIFSRLGQYIDHSASSDLSAPLRNCCIAVPAGATPVQHRAYRTAAEIAGFKVIALVPEHTAVACLYALKRSTDTAAEGSPGTPPAAPPPEEPPRTIVFADMGCSNFTLSLATIEKGKVTIAAAVNEPMGGNDFDTRIYNYAQNVIKEKYQFDVTKSARFVLRLRAAAEKAKNSLSTLKETELNFSAPEQDIKIVIARTQFEQWCAPELARMNAVVSRFISTAGVDLKAISGVEVVGGGTRIPMVSQILENTFGRPLSHGMDSTLSVGLGAAAYGSCITPGYNTFGIVDLTTKEEDLDIYLPVDLEKYKEIEKQMYQTDHEVELTAKAKNDIEHFVYTTKHYLNDEKFKDCFSEESKVKFSSILHDLSIWLEDNQESSLAQYQAKMEEAKSSGFTIAPLLYQRLDEIEKEKAKAAAEAAAAAPTVNKKSKPLSNRQKLDEAAAKKEQGNKLFVDLDYVNAIKRYTQALEFMATMFDVSPEQKEEGNKLKLQCYLNLAGCLLKVEAYQKAIENCKLALEIEPENSKALFRRGQAYFEQKEYELARDDLTKADKLTPNNKQILQILAKSKKEIATREEREKKMYAKMFS